MCQRGGGRRDGRRRDSSARRDGSRGDHGRVLPHPWAADRVHVGSRLLWLWLPLRLWPLWSTDPWLHLWSLVPLSSVAVLQVCIWVVAGVMTVVRVMMVMVRVMVSAMAMVGVGVVAGVAMRVCWVLVGVGAEAVGRIMSQV